MSTVASINRKIFQQLAVVIKAYENNLLISFHFETNRQLNQRNMWKFVGLFFLVGKLVPIMTVSLEIISLASLMVVTVISSFPHHMPSISYNPIPLLFSQKPKIYN